MKKKGFTLVELLAVIVILAIIAVIATPMILNVIDNAKKGAAEASASGYIDAIEKGILEEELKGNIINKNKIYNVSELDFVNIKGDKPTEGIVSLEEGIVKDYSLKIGEYVINNDNGKIKAEKSDIVKQLAICKRAKTLHTEECTQTSTSAYCSEAGYTADGTKGTTTITYGNLGTTGTLTSGDAFDCDVNGDGTYDEATERFYYVSDLDSDSNTAVLIYYNNVSGGEPSNTTTYAYDANNVNNMGPVTAALQLPTTTQWNNVSLSSTSRQITNETGGTTTGAGDIVTFDYSNYAARLLTYQETAEACGITISAKAGELNGCNYLMENTKYSNSTLGTYGYWLETPRSSDFNDVWRVFGNHRYVSLNDAGVNNLSGVRPVIEVPKTKIQY